MTDPYRIFEQPVAPGPVPPPSGRRIAVRPLLWLALVISFAANAAASAADFVVVGAGFGLIALTCATALIDHHYRLRRR